MTNKITDLLSFASRKNLPSYLQTEVAECGLACLAMVSTYHGYEIDLPSLRNKFSVSLRGMNLQTMITLADKMNFTSRPLRLELDEMDQLKTPAILHWDLNHFVVLKKATKNKVVIHDPAIGVRTLSYEEVSKSFTGVALELAPSQDFEPKKEVQKVRLSVFWQQISGLKRNLINIFLLSMALQVFGLLSPLYMQTVVDDGLTNGNRSLIQVLSLGFLLLGFIEICTTALRSYIILFLSKNLTIQMASNLFRHLIRLPLSFFEKRHVGDIVSKFGSLSQIESLLTTGVVQTFVDGIMAITTLFMMYTYSPLLSNIVVASVVIYGLVRLAWYKPFREISEESIVAGAKTSTNFMENIRGIQSIKIFGKEIQRQGVWQNLYAKQLNTGIRSAKMGIWYSTLNSFLSSIQNIVVVYVAATMVLSEPAQFSIGMIFAFTSYKGSFQGKASALIDKYIEIKMLSLHLERLGDIALTKIEKDDNEVETSHSILGEIKACDLGYQYSDDEPLVFKDLNFTINTGESVAIVGPSGCGKTTLVKVLMGLFEPNSGCVKIDGLEIPKIGKKAYREQIAAVMQDDQLLSGSIEENISFFATELNSEKVIESAKLAGIHEDIMQMPMAYSTLMGDMGTTLSGGQKQRVMLARALYMEPKILFLDEATSHLDVALEQVVNASIRELKITRVVIAHRPETIKAADRVLVLTPEGLLEPPRDTLNLPKD